MILVTDTQNIDKSFLDDIYNLVNTGEIPNLFTAEEKSEIAEVRNSSI